ncbi:hypothetical protein ABZW18_28535 [Streptomyces sp. NPDC004647]|uniref:hypothetical protein n=1 Tax=Streptomyces sp. NPDC004647 TaxID=3154671 RepID=UPI0033AB7927
MGHNRSIRGERRWVGVLALIAAACCAATTVVFSPGYMSPDTMSQLNQAMGERPLSDWHPPVLSLAWRALIALTGTPASMAALQSVILWGALWVIAGCVWELTASRPGSLAVLGLGLTPHVLTFAGVVWKDVHMAFALLAASAVALVGLRLRGGPPARRWALLGLGVLFLAYAALVRKNAIFAVIPVFVMLVLALWHTPGRRRWAMSTAVLAVGLAVPAVAVSSLARPVQTSQGAQIMLDDLVHVLSVEELQSAAVSQDLRGRLVAAAKECDRIGALSDAYWACYERRPDGLVRDAEELTSLWVGGMADHVPGYLQYRLQLFSELLFDTSFRYQDGVIDNDLGLGVSHPRLEATLQRYITGMGEDLPFLFAGWFWLAAALVLSIRPGKGVFAMPVRALGISAAAYVLGYLPIMPATDYRYVYWPAIAVTLGLLLSWLGRGTTPPPADPGVARNRDMPEHQPVDSKNQP